MQKLFKVSYKFNSFLPADDAPLEGEVWDFFRFLLAGSAGGVGNEGGGAALGDVPAHS